MACHTLAVLAHGTNDTITGVGRVLVVAPHSIVVVTGSGIFLGTQVIIFRIGKLPANLATSCN